MVRPNVSSDASRPNHSDVRPPTGISSTSKISNLLKRLNFVVNHDLYLQLYAKNPKGSMYRQFLSDTHAVLLPVGSANESIRYLHQAASRYKSEEEFVHVNRIQMQPVQM